MQGSHDAAISRFFCHCKSQEWMDQQAISDIIPFVRCLFSIATAYYYAITLDYVNLKLWDVYYLYCASLTASSLSTLVTPQCNSSPQCVTIHPVTKYKSCHKAIMVITGRAHCYIFCMFRSLPVQFVGLGKESPCGTFNICTMQRSLLAVRALSWLHNAFLPHSV